METTANPVLANADLFFSVGKYLMVAVLNPKREKDVISDVTEISVVASPICSGVKSRALITQKKNPRTARTP